MNSVDLYEGLAAADPIALETILETCKQRVERAVTLAGGSSADGKVFFKTGAVSLAEMVRHEQVQTEVPFAEALEQLALAQFYNWLEEREQLSQHPSQVASGMLINMPAPEQLQHTRRKIFAWKQLDKLPREAEGILRDLVLKGASTDSSGKLPHYRAAYRNALQLQEQDPEPWPDWVRTAFEDKPGLELWRQLNAQEARRENFGATKSRGDRLPKWIFLSLIALTLGYAAWQYFTKARPAAEVFNENFDPPHSILSDLDRRYGAQRGNDSVTARPNECERLMREADHYYTQGDWDSAEEPLFAILSDTNSICHSDALYYIGVMRLQQDDPATALECFSKIDNLEAFGEDIYWNQALCFVKLAAENPSMRKRAVRAVERFLSQTQDEKRRRLAEKMLDDLK